MISDIIQAIKDYETIIIHRHVNPDPDALGSQMGLKSVLEATFPEKKIYVAGENEPSLANFGQMDDIPDELYSEALVIINDTANTERIDDQRYQGAKMVIKVDHHPNHDSYGDINYVLPEASAASEIWADILLSHPETFTMTDQGAEYLFLGIVGDTGRFLYDNTSVKTMAIATELRKYDFPASERMQASLTETMGQARLKGYVLENFKLSEDGLVNAVFISQKVLKDLGVTEAESHNIVQTPGSVQGVLAWVIFVEKADGSMRCRIRSKGPAINQIAQAHEGGGHAKASGANAYSKEECQAIVAELNEAARNYLKEKGNEE
ncbi:MULTISPECIES: DHH family phosphoesterase [Aerococcus]|uniref:Bifunctional oligoribonuclease/PAP phosphatase NrnA n=3 Tax=Lactobacillales TaxID=186826 RepID=A0A178HHZ3_9LACT|nr:MULTISPECIES: bifunctional oligoribonuclease/PAP phosphatase NrnA [Aerococcus]KAA9217959.1 bifunctional oligoribonuclease/PAP phosphatase NrnA [Aerococcus loyolae]KAA9266402.1 bifunctional oligoribonuclease/PAP phosphatase NrnA [Aerococcus loyolae]MCY3025099.1 bifunctional oligoribonuclease/PAP phosphatase NrnA [Aerococcus loyolae]MCY3028158.1 bifunctional oligoribonuclease/PAP phosphatase NrnA [Aerococcus loyolae]MCY3029190.1 bifunctional oligoribonuclease/PAP phosphatase NrnA [Aerococcus 